MKTVRFLAAALAAWGIMSACPAAELLTNGSFEDVKDGQTVGWNVPEHYAFADGVGMNGTRALVFENRDDKEFYKYPSAQIAFEKGKRYEYSVWAKTEGLSGRAQLCVEWYDASGKWLSGSYQGGFGGTKDWAQLKGVTAPIPSEAARVSVSFLVSKGGLGKVWFDDVSVKPLERPVFGGLYSSAYRNLSADGKVRFHAAVNLVNHLGARVTFAYSDAGGTERRVRPTRLTGTAAILEIEAAYLAKGTHPVSCEIVSPDGARIGGGSIDFTRVDELPKRRVWFDAKRRTIVDGKPFFPLGIYIVGVNEKQFAELLTGPFNCVMPYVEPDVQQLDFCRANGIEVIYPLNSVWAWHRHRPKGVSSDDDAQVYVARVVNEKKDHPAIMAWYCNDEISLEKFPQLLERQRLLERIDPGHPTWTVLYQYGEVRGYYPTFDVVGTDPYPIPGSSIGNVAMWTRTTDAEVMGLKPMWQVPQAFAWADCRGPERKNDRFPTREEMVNMTWQCVANGANGLVYWCYRLQYQKGKFLVDRWADICAAAASVKPYIPVILSDEEPPKVTGANEDLSVRAWRYQDDVYLAVVNNTRKQVKGEIGIDGTFEELTTLQGAKGCTLKGLRAVAIALDGLEVSFVRAKPQR